MGTHLWFVLTDPDPKTGLVVLVMLVSVKPHTDKTVQLDVGDHPFVKHPSNVDYSTATFVPSSRLEQRIASGVIALDADLSAQVLEWIRRGLLSSSRTINAIGEYCRALWAV